MAIINKEKYLKDIARMVKRGAMYFEAEDRPQIEMGGRQVYIGSVSFDYDRGEMAYKVYNRVGNEIPSAHGVRPLQELDLRTLSSVKEVVANYHRMALERERNISKIFSQVGSLRRRGPQMSL